ncbi:hypothetical protein QJR26_18015 (plasmid) [Clostridium baratii]
MKDKLLIVSKGDLNLIRDALISKREEVGKQAFELINTESKDLVNLKSQIAQMTFLIRDIESELKNEKLNEKKRAI